MANTPWRRASILLDVDAGVRHSESSTVPSAPGAGYGMFWVRDDATTVPMFTDSIGGDTVLGTGGAPDRIAQSGIITEALQFFVDFNNQSSWTPNQLTTWTDTIASTAGTAANTTITAGHLNFNGTTSEVDFGTVPAALVNLWTGGGTAATWCRVESQGIDSTSGRIYDTTDAAVEGSLFAFLEESAGAVRAHLAVAFTSGFGYWKTTDLAVTLDEWVHVAITFDSDSPATPPVFYVNGVSVAVTVTTAPTGTVISDTGNDFTVGNRNDLARTFDGDIEMLGLYDATLTSTEIVDLYNASKTRFGVAGAADTLYTADGTLAGNRIVTMGANDLTFSGTGATNYSSSGLNTFAGNVILSGTANKFLQNTPTVGYVPTATNADGSWTWQAGGSASTWTDVLTAGNISGGNNAVLSSGDSLIGVDSAVSGTPGTDLVFRGGNMTAAAGGAVGGNVTIDGGSTDGTVGTAVGGDVTITSGNSTGSGGGGPGDLFLLGATPSGGTKTGGSVTIQAGDGAPAFNTTGGSVILRSGDGGLSTFGAGPITITGGETSDGHNNGGPITITAGANVGTGSGGNGGNLTMSAGDSVVEDGGDVFINGGDMTGATSAADTGGSITLTAGTGTTPNYNIGSLNLIVPSPASPSTENVASGNVNITAGHNGTRNNPGGAINLTAGDTYGGVPNDGGMIVMTPGTSLLGIDGRAKIAGTGTLEMIERTTALGFIAGSGYFWVRDDAPNVPMFTNDVGTDFVLSDNLYTADGTLSGARAVAFGSNAMTFSGAGEFIVNNTSKFLQDTPAIGEVATATGVDGSWTWQAAAGGTVELGLAVQATGTTNPALMDASFAWRITNGQALTFEATDGTDILAISAAGGGDSVTFMAGAGAIAVTDGNIAATGGSLIVESSNAGSNILVQTAAGSGGAAGDLQFLTGAGDAAGDGGNFAVALGNGGANGNGGDFTGAAGNGGATSGAGGNVSFAAGQAGNAAGSPGTALLRAGHGGVAAVAGGTVTVEGGDGNTTGGGGTAIVQGGAAGVSGAGGSVQVLATSGGATSGAGGSIIGSAGGASSATAANAGNITFTAGSATNGGGSGDGGTVSLQPGTAAGSGADGSLIFDYSTYPAVEGAADQFLQTDGAGALSWVSATANSTAWSEETATTTDATVGVTVATPIPTVTDGTQHSVEVLITGESGGANTYFRRQIFTYYRDGGGAVQWTQEINGAEARRGLAVTVVASLTAVGNAVLVNVTGQAATNIDWTVQYRTTNTIQNGGTVSTTGIVRETFDNRSSAVTTGSASASGGTVDFTISAGAAYVTLQFLRVVTATGTCADATVQFFRDAGRTDEIYDAQNKDPSTQYTDRVPATMMGNDGSGLASNTMYGRITNNDAGAATFDVEAVLWGVA